MIRASIVVVTCSAAAATGLMARQVDVPRGYALAWSEEFATAGRPDAANWTFETGFVRNEEAQWYQPANARVDNGLLVIEARRERGTNPTYVAGATDWRRGREFHEYTSSSLTTRGLRSWQFGRFEMRARIDTRPGLWPAFWTLGTAGRWPANGEIDIMEFYRGQVLANVAWLGPTQGRALWDDVRRPLASLGDANWSARFHTWRMDWDRDFVRLFVDDELLNEVDLARTVNADGSGVNPLRQPHYLLVNLAVGGTQGGDPSATMFPARYEVDYIRVFQKPSSLAGATGGNRVSGAGRPWPPEVVRGPVACCATITAR